MKELELNRLRDSRFQLETQVNTLEPANMNAKTMVAVKKVSDALKVMHAAWCRRQHVSLSSIIFKIHNCFFFFKDELKHELEDLQQDESLNERLNQAIMYLYTNHQP
jgi:charged multivesicular body protein 4A/B